MSITNRSFLGAVFILIALAIFIAQSGGGAGTVTGVTGTAPIVSSGGIAPAISLTLLTTGADADSVVTTNDSGLEVIDSSLSLYRGCADGELMKWVEATDTWDCSADNAGGGSAVVFDIGDDGGDDSLDLNEIATTGDTNAIFTESAADKMLIAVGNNWPTADTADRLTFQVRNSTGAALLKGRAVYISGFHVGTALTEVTYADSDAAGTMPAIGLVVADIANNTNGLIIEVGQLIDIDTSAFVAGDELYISGATGILTDTKPTGAALIQKVAIVARAHLNNGVVEVFGAGRSNDIPNIVDDSIWVGSATGVGTATAIGDCDAGGGLRLNYDTATNTVSCNALVDADVPNNITIDLATAASALVANPTDCAANNYTHTIAANGDLTCSTIDVSDSVNITAGRSLTLTGDDVLADAELYTDTKCIWFEDPVAADDFNSIWRNSTANALTLTELWAESDQTVTFMLQVDDGTPADIDTVDLAPAAGEAEDVALDGDTTLAASEELDLAVTSVAGVPTWVSICWTFTWND